MSMPDTDSDDGKIEKILAEIQEEPEESDIPKKEVKKVVEWDEHIDTVKDYEDGSDVEIKKEDEFD